MVLIVVKCKERKIKNYDRLKIDCYKECLVDMKILFENKKKL